MKVLISQVTEEVRIYLRRVFHTLGQVTPSVTWETLVTQQSCDPEYCATQMTPVTLVMTDNHFPKHAT